MKKPLLLAFIAFAFSLRLIAAEPSATAYLFAYFVKNGEDGLHLAAGADGYTYEALNDGKSYLTPRVGESKLMRDPCLLRGPDGTFHLVWTTAWEGKTIGYASSKDLINWSEQKALPVMVDEPGTRNCWAPEIAYDEDKKHFLIFWSTTVTGKFPETQIAEDKGYNHRVYATTTKDFVTFTPTRLFYEPGFNVIDATLLKDNQRFHLIVKDETRVPVKKHLRIASSDKIDGPYTDLSAPFTRDWVEGPTAIKVGDNFVVFYDCYRDKHYGAVRTKDFKTWEDVTDKIKIPAGVRHGTIIEVPATLIATLRSPIPAKP
ncbi:MAG: glycoside hydrolase family 43 protein [Nibricoccus sp.]